MVVGMTNCFFFCDHCRLNNVEKKHWRRNEFGHLMRMFGDKCIYFSGIRSHGTWGCSENASECFLQDLDHWAAHKVFNLSTLCKAELIFRAVCLNSICAKLQREIYAWSPSHSLFSLFSPSLIPPPTPPSDDLVISLLIYNKWTLSWLALCHL